MRKIERLMNAAISDNKNWQLDNTCVTYDADTNESTVYLYGNKIAEIGDDYIRLFDGGYQSNTTKSRINAIMTEHGIAGEGVYQKNYKCSFASTMALNSSSLSFALVCDWVLSLTVT